MAVECTANVLAELSSCFTGLNPKQQQAIVTYLLCQIANNGGGGVPSGVILMWSGTIATIPTGWVLCDGANGTPDLRNRFVVAADADSAGTAMTTLTGAATQSGGSISHTHSVTDPGHTHTTFADEAEAGSVFPVFALTTINANTTGITVDSQSAPQPYFSLAYIMKT
jgi:microcystin-dependent protein